LKKTAVLCVIRHGDHLLLLLRGKEPNMGMYVPVGGHVEPFEAARDAAIREVREEAGLVLDDLRFCGVLVETSPTKYNWVSFVYSAEAHRTPPVECAEGILEWVAIDRLEELPTPQTDMHIYRLVLMRRFFALDARFDKSVDLVSMRDEITGELLYERP
jgi:8-oxo-dGTP diphosphatase